MENHKAKIVTKKIIQFCISTKKKLIFISGNGGSGKTELSKIISKEESESLTKEKISERWRELLHGTGINPINMHPHLWFWSRNNF